MLAVHRRFLQFDQGLYSVISNALINGVIAWAINRNVQVFGFNGHPGVVVNTLAISFLLPLLVCLIVTPLVARKVRSGALPALSTPSAGLSRRPTWVRGLVLGSAGVTLVALPILGLWAAVGPSEIGLFAFVLFTGSMAGLLAAFATPITAWWALQRSTQTQSGAT